MKKILFALLLTAAIVSISVFSTFAVRRDQIGARRAGVDHAWMRVNEAILLRNDLVPSVLSAIRATATRDRSTAAEVKQASSDLQAAATPQATIEASQRLDTAMGTLIADAQNDPDLLANRRFFVLQDKWAAATNRIATERSNFDQTVRDYNDFIADFPNRVFASWASYSAATDYFSNQPAPATAALIGN
ncbi:MAG: LemA family protein [Terriglobales bacterium]